MCPVCDQCIEKVSNVTPPQRISLGDAIAGQLCFSSPAMHFCTFLSTSSSYLFWGVFFKVSIEITLNSLKSTILIWVRVKIWGITASPTLQILPFKLGELAVFWVSPCCQLPNMMWLWQHTPGLWGPASVTSTHTDVTCFELCVPRLVERTFSPEMK